MITRVRSAAAPVLEAVKIAKEQIFFDKYGTDIEKIPEKIRIEIEPELRKAITKELQKKLVSKKNLPDTLSGIKSTESQDEDKSFKSDSLSDLFD